MTTSEINKDLSKTIVCDCDGVLTDGKLYMDHTGEKMFKAFHSRDVRAIRELVANGYRFVIVTADEGDINAAFADKTGAEFLYCRNKDLIPFEYDIAIGDDAWDVPMLKKANKTICPADADKAAKNICLVHLETKGGHGVIAELVRILSI